MTTELELFKDTLDRFIDDQIAPHYEKWEKDHFMPREIWNLLGENGFLAVDVPEEYGGYGVDFSFSTAVNDAFAKKSMSSLACGLSVHSDIVTHYIVNNGTDEQKQTYLPKMVSGECVGAIAMTEPGAGSDLQGLRTTAKKTEGGYIINGSKTFITNGQHCDIVIVAAKTNPDVPGAKGLSLFIVDKDTEGFSRGRNLDKIGLYSQDTSELFFDNVFVPDTALLGAVDRGFAVLMNELPRERLSLALNGVAAAEGAIAETINYVKERKAFGAPIAALQNTRFRLAEMETDVRVHRAFVNECVDKFNRGELDVTSVSMAKFSCTDMQCRVADGCLQLFGGYGYMCEYPIARAFVDARVQRIYGGTNEIMKELISRDILK
jgi:acyl-CoA dehydrogenase